MTPLEYLLVGTFAAAFLALCVATEVIGNADDT